MGPAGVLNTVAWVCSSGVGTADSGVLGPGETPGGPPWERLEDSSPWSAPSRSGYVAGGEGGADLQGRETGTRGGPRLNRSPCQPLAVTARWRRERGHC